MRQCRVCGNEITPVFDLGPQYVSNFLKTGDDPGPKIPLTLAHCGTCGLVQLTETVDPDVMYRKKYWYRSGVNESMRKALSDVVESTLAYVGEPDATPVWVDIGANDGTLLSLVPEEWVVVGFDPAFPKPDFGCRMHEWFRDYFTADGHNIQAHVVTAIACFYDLDDPNKFVSDIKKVLHPDGVFVIQMSYLRTMLGTHGFDNICHEHLEYYDLTSLEYLLNKHDLQVQDVTFNDVNGGSFRVFVTHKGRKLEKVQRGRIHGVREREERQGVRALIDVFSQNVREIKTKTLDFIDQEIAKKKSFWVYGASTKGNTLLQYYGLDSNHFQGAVERSPEKVGRYTVGTNIPIVSEDSFRRFNDTKNTYLFVLPWHFIDGFIKREGDFLMKGGKFFVPLPIPEVIDMRLTRFNTKLWQPPLVFYG